MGRWPQVSPLKPLPEVPKALKSEHFGLYMGVCDIDMRGTLLGSLLEDPTFWWGYFRVPLFSLTSSPPGHRPSLRHGHPQRHVLGCTFSEAAPWVVYPFGCSRVHGPGGLGVGFGGGWAFCFRGVGFGLHKSGRFCQRHSSRGSRGTTCISMRWAGRTNSWEFATSPVMQTGPLDPEFDDLTWRSPSRKSLK